MNIFSYNNYLFFAGITRTERTFLIYFVCFSLLLIGILIYLLIKFSESLNKSNLTISQLKRSFNELDEQAKLIISTDFELNKAHEELDKRINGLNALQKTSNIISTSLNEDAIFNSLDESLILDLGFEKNMIFIFNKDQALECKKSIGFKTSDVSTISKTLTSENFILEQLKNGKIISSSTSEKVVNDFCLDLFKVKHFVLAPIRSSNTCLGMVFAGNQSNVTRVSEGDEELLSILSTQLSQGLINARLFEEVYKSRQELEKKVQYRTKQLELALREVQNISKKKSEFISAVSHELRTPLTSIKGYAVLLMSGRLGDIPEGVKQRLDKINKNSDSLVSLINNLLDISRIESGRVEMRLIKCSMVNLIESTHDLLTPQMLERKINWKTDIETELPECPIDPSQYERVFINLIGNAIKFTPEDGMISVKAYKKESFVKFEISDTGIGISEEDLKKLFDEFYRVENKINQNVKGTGLGLPLAKKIVEAHGGKMWATSVINQGTTFHFTLPFKKA